MSSDSSATYVQILWKALRLELKSKGLLVITYSVQTTLKAKACWLMAKQLPSMPLSLQEERNERESFTSLEHVSSSCRGS